MSGGIAGAAGSKATVGNGCRVLVVEDDADFRGSLALLLEREGFSVAEAETLDEAQARLRASPPDVVFVDLGLPDGNGLDLLAADSAPPRPDFVVISGRATIESAVQAVRRGALDFLQKPVDRARLKAILAHVRRTREWRNRERLLRAELRELGHFGPLVGRSAPMQLVYDLVSRVAPARSHVWIVGEPGTGKELTARTLHQMSPRATGSFRAVDCGAVAPDRIERVLFGSAPGSLPGAEPGSPGCLEEAHGGSLLLEEPAEMSAEMQVRLLGVLEAGRLFRVGGAEPVAVDVRIIAASFREPEAELHAGRLREDLYYALTSCRIPMPPLRARGDDVPMLAEHFLAAFNAREGTARRWSAPALRRLREHAWPGNVRELANVVERAAVLAGDVVEDPGLPESTPDAPAPDAPAPEEDEITVAVGTPLAEVERRMLDATLRMLGGDKRETARRLGISLKTLYNRLNVYRASPRADR